jgi:hypothetical protein
MHFKEEESQREKSEQDPAGSQKGPRHNNYGKEGMETEGGRNGFFLVSTT